MGFKPCIYLPCCNCSKGATECCYYGYSWVSVNYSTADHANENLQLSFFPIRTCNWHYCIAFNHNEPVGNSTLGYSFSFPVERLILFFQVASTLFLCPQFLPLLFFMKKNWW